MPTPAQPARRPAAAPAKPAQPPEQPPEAPSESAPADQVEDPFARQDAEDASGVESDIDLENDEFDISDVEAVSGREVIPNGTYDFFIESAEYKLSKNNNRMIAMVLLVRMPDSQEYGPQRLYHHATFSEKTTGRAKHDINVLMNGEVDWAHTKPSAIAEQLPGRYGRAKVFIKNDAEYGRSNNIREILPPAEAMGGFAN